MRYVAFKKSNSNPGLKGALHPEFVTEYAYCDLFPVNHFQVEDGWSIETEETFLQEYSQNEARQQQFQEKQKLIEESKARSELAAKQVSAQEERRLKKEQQDFERFKLLRKR